MLTHEAMSRGPVERADKRFRSGDCDVTWGGGPLFHIGSLAPFIGSIGASGTYLTDTFFNPARAVALMKRERSEEHTSELQSLMRISYAVFCLKQKNTTKSHH